MRRAILAALVVLAPLASRAQTVPSPTVPSPTVPSLTVPSPTVDAIRAAGHLSCGTIEAVDDWNGLDLHGDLSDLGQEICRAVATAVLGAPNPGAPDPGAPGKVEAVVFPSELDALGGLKSQRVQLAVGLTPEVETAVQYGVGFARPVFYDSYRLMVLKGVGIESVAGLKDRLICAMEASPAERSLRDEMTARAIPYALQAHSEQGEMDASVAVARCTAGYALESRLADSRADFPANAPEFVFLPERLGVVPASPAYRDGDRLFGLIVDATVNALIEAEALGITKDNVAAAKQRTDTRARQLLGGDITVARALGLPNDWAARVIASVGNYGEIFDRTLGKRYRLDRGLNALWTSGGLMVPTPMQ